MSLTNQVHILAYHHTQIEDCPNYGLIIPFSYSKLKRIQILEHLNPLQPSIDATHHKCNHSSQGIAKIIASKVDNKLPQN